ncbi:MAG: ABC transporter substrate-binding protein/permease [Syntrophomonadaceae bacterium]|nr:ABC transporter substrate-binding protein/permease [Syntrophomonadaceae bacterium]
MNNRPGQAVRLLLMGALLCALLLTGGCAASEEGRTADLADTTGETQELAGYPTLETLNGQPLGVLTGSVFDQITADKFPASQRFYYTSAADQLMALIQGRIDGFLSEEPLAQTMMREEPRVNYLPEMIDHADYGFAISPTATGTRYRDEINVFLAGLEADGTLDMMRELWFSEDESVKLMDDSATLTAVNGTLIFATTAMMPPFTYIRDGQVVGYEVALLTRFCKEKGYGLRINVMNFESILPGLASGKYDMAADCITITEERAQSIHFSIPTYNSNVVMMVRAEDAGELAAGGGFIEDFKDSFYKNFVEENRWRLIASGIGVTLVISLFSALFGSVVGFGVCFMRRSRRRLLSDTAKVYIRIMQGTPIVVLLMLLFHVVFSKTALDGVTIAIIGFGLNYAAYAAEILRSGIDAVDRGQFEAAAAIGFNPRQTFIKIVFPQAARHFLPVLKGEFISLVKMTSVVGYVAVQDLTKASDIIRSRTFEGFFPLIVTAVIYFLLTWILAGLISRLEIRTDPKRRPLKLPYLDALMPPSGAPAEKGDVTA